MTSQDHVEGKLANHGAAHVDEAVGSLFQQQGTTQVRILQANQMRIITTSCQQECDTHSQHTSAAKGP